MEDAGALLENGAALYVPGGSFLPPEAGLPCWLPPTNFFFISFFWTRWVLSYLHMWHSMENTIPQSTLSTCGTLGWVGHV